MKIRKRLSQKDSLFFFLGLNSTNEISSNNLKGKKKVKIQKTASIMAAYWPYILPQTATLGITKTKRMNTFIVHADGKISKALVAIFKALDVPFEIKKEKREEESPYDPEFVKKILERAENAKKGNVVEYTPELKKQWFGK